jgi:hypothetical protein
MFGCMHLIVSTCLTLIMHVALILSWGKASDQIKNETPLFRGLSFLLMDHIAPSVCVTTGRRYFFASGTLCPIFRSVPNGGIVPLFTR